ncbi:MAG: FHA domain-containing protein [Planctomycetota bacterium]
MAKLILRSADGAETELPLDELGSASIGRAPECDMPITDGQASRRHCSVVKLSSGWEMSDLGSTNGTLVNSTLTKKKRLSHGDVIRIGETEIVFHDMEGASSGDAADGQNGLLVYAKGDRKGQKIELAEQRTTFGRKESNTIPINDANVSSYHCEIVRDLNGYTIRDLGSTNGTLVNSEMITEVQLAHGAKVRIGQLLFVFQDPAMAEVDLDLAGVDDDDQEWGMMRELDLAAVRKRNPATIFYSLLFVALVGGAYYMLQVAEVKKSKGGGGPPKGSVLWSSFETLAEAYKWDTDPGGDVETGVTEKAKVTGKQGLRISSTRESADVFFADTLPADGRRYEVSAHVGVSGGAEATLAIRWEGSGVSRWAESEPASGSKPSELTGMFSSPSWARRAYVAIRVRGSGQVFMDDVVVFRRGSAAPETAEANSFKLGVVDGRVDLRYGRSPILVNGNLEGAEDGAAMGCQKEDELHIALTVADAGFATSVDVVFAEHAGFLGQGFRAFGSVDGERYLDTAFPDEGKELKRTGVRKLLLGSSGRAFSVLGENETEGFAVTADWVGGRRRLRLSIPTAGGAGKLLLKTDLRDEARQAADQVSEADGLYDDKKLGSFLRLARETLAEFPFADPTSRRRLSEQLGIAMRGFGTLSRAAQDGLEEYKEFRDLESLDRVRATLAEMKATYELTGSEGPWGELWLNLDAAERTARGTAERRRQGDLADPLFQLANEFYLPSGQVHAAAVLFSYVGWYLPESPQAEKATAELAKLGKEYPAVLEVLKRLKES